MHPIAARWRHHKYRFQNTAKFGFSPSGPWGAKNQIWPYFEIHHSAVAPTGGAETKLNLTQQHVALRPSLHHVTTSTLSSIDPHYHSCADWTGVSPRWYTTALTLAWYWMCHVFCLSLKCRHCTAYYEQTRKKFGNNSHVMTRFYSLELGMIKIHKAKTYFPTDSLYNILMQSSF